MLFIRKPLLTLTALAVALFLGIASRADIIATTGAVVDIGNNGPANSAVPQGPGQNNEIIYAWNEQQGVVLGAALIPEVLGPIAAGTIVNSHMLRFDPVTEGNRIGTATFDGPILGIFTLRDSLDDTDFLGSPGTTYPAHPSAPLRGLEEADFLAVTDPFSILVRWNASNPGDQIRVVTAVVPEPGSIALLMGFGLAGGLLMRRRIRR